MNTHHASASRRRFNLALLAAATLPALPLAAAAQSANTYPNKAIRMVVPFTPGGSTDIMGRTIGQQLTQAWGQPVVIDNLPGAGGSIGADKVAKAPADGYTLLMGHIGTLAVTPSLYPKLPYDPVKSFAAVAWVARVPNVLVVHPSVPVKSVQELVAYAKANPGKINYGSGGNGSAAHIATEYFKLQTGTQMQHVPYKGTAPAVTDLVGGQIQLMFTGVPAVMAQVKAGQLRALAVSSPHRVKAVPELPTVAESGYAGFEADQWYGVVAPANTPPDVTAKLNQQINRALASPEIAERLASEGAEATPNPPKVFADLIVSEIARWRTVIEKGGVKVE
ncbi:ABC transporter substrate-binding protein [Rhodoferax koreense]|uniref:ABC transporter substrate-binding protein n=1 Tax=Rhodoferax koreensis TaxID=1842727 RepID=A0A1P8JW89_9BURK|nr:tripartite tricarboxylate transporter substrate binding protein [Rhodoferax koreense]APW37998.1 ABC transporter substrate-binding protein [Rhodoferax koreense]